MFQTEFLYQARERCNCDCRVRLRLRLRGSPPPQTPLVVQDQGDHWGSLILRAEWRLIRIFNRLPHMRHIEPP
jgi:hypothetical protein